MRRPEPLPPGLWAALWVVLGVLVAVHGAGSGWSVPKASASFGMPAY